MKKEKLYFVISLDKDNHFQYIYILAEDRKSAKTKFEEKYPSYDIKKIETMHPSKKVIEEVNKYTNKQ